MSDAWATLAPGFADPGADAQHVFRHVLHAMAHPGRVQALPPAVLAGQVPSIAPSLGAVLLALLDSDTALHLHRELGGDAASRYWRFHTGCRIADAPEHAAFTAARAAHADAALWQRLPMGSDEAPQDGATLLLEVDALADDAPLRNASCLQLRGPGLREPRTLAVAGPSADFWRARIAAQDSAPRGIDLLLGCGERLVALPRSTRIRLED